MVKIEGGSFKAFSRKFAQQVQNEKGNVRITISGVLNCEWIPNVALEKIFKKSEKKLKKFLTGCGIRGTLSKLSKMSV